jgi:8-oxo-dGTP pyrophosphatase MutT (NUDIX family)
VTSLPEASAGTATTRATPAPEASADLHADGREVLLAWLPPDDEQGALRDSYVEFLDLHPDAMWRACVDGHLTGSTLVLSHDRSHVLLTLHSKIKRWLQMGGHCEPGDTSLRAAAGREALEESGIAGLVLSAAPARLDRHRVGCHGGSWHLDVQYVATAATGAVEVISDESLDLRWWPVDALPHDTDDALRALVTAALRTP